MRKFSILTTSLILLFATNCFAINLDTIAIIESNNNSSAYNKKSKASGKYQITPVCLADFNDYHKTPKYAMKDMFVDSRGYTVANWYLSERIPQLLRHYKLDVTDGNILISYNWGIGNLKKWVQNGSKDEKLPLETRNYIKKYKNGGYL